MAEYDNDSLREFLDRRGWSEGAVEMFGLFAGYEARMNSSFIDIIRPEIGGSFQDLVELEGGSDRLPYAFLPSLRPTFALAQRWWHSINRLTMLQCTRTPRRALFGFGRLCHSHAPVSGDAPYRVSQAFLVGETTGDPSGAL